MKEVVAQAFPELVEFGFTESRVREPLLERLVCVDSDDAQLCWYTDTIDEDVSQ